MMLACGPAISAGAPTAAREPPPGEGLVCVWALVVSAAEVGRRCFPGENPEFQAELERSEAKLDAFVRANAGSRPLLTTPPRAPSRPTMAVSMARPSSSTT